MPPAGYETGRARHIATHTPAMRRHVPPPPAPPIILDWSCLDENFRAAVTALSDIDIDAGGLAAALACAGTDAPRSLDQVLALLALVPDHREKLPADILADERAGVLRLIDTAQLARAARLAEGALAPLRCLLRAGVDAVALPVCDRQTAELCSLAAAQGVRIVALTP